jgi:hypothetical protein
MTRNDDAFDTHEDALMPEERADDLKQRFLLSGAGILAVVGLAGFAAARLPEVAAVAPESVTSLPYLLGASVLVFGLGAGAFAFMFNLFTEVATVGQAKKVASVYLPVVGLLSALVDAGAFHPRLAMVFVCLLAAFGVVYALFRGTSLIGLGRQNA